MSLRGALARNQAAVPHVGRRFGVTPGVTIGGGYEVTAIEAYGSNGTLFAIVNRTANATAAVDWHLHRRVNNRSAICGAEGCDALGVELVERHAALAVWNKPNPFMTRQEFVETFQQHLDLTGEADWVTGTVRGFTSPTELWPVRPDRIIPVPHPTQFLSGYLYRGHDGERIPLDTKQVIQLRMPNPGDPYRGLGPVQSLLTDLDSARYSAQWNRQFFTNSAEPGGVIEVPEHLGDDEFEEMRSRWNEQHRGVANAHRVAIIENGKWVPRAFSQRDMQFVELRQLSSEMIREAFGFPKAMLGTTDDVNRANAEAAQVIFARWVLTPRLERIKGALNADFLPLFGATAAGLEFAYRNPVPDDREQDSKDLTARVSAVVALVGAGADPASACATVGLPLIVWRAATPSVQPVAALRMQPDNAMRWAAVEEIDDDTCGPCRENHGKLYRNREDAYQDYPDGGGYVNCIGAEHGNSCRGKVVKRKAQG